MAKFSVGQVVVCVRSESPKYDFLVGHVGEVTHVLQSDPLVVFLGIKHEYGVHFPTVADRPCPGCGKVHNTPYAMYEFELKALEDPDKDVEDETPRDLSQVN